MQGLTLQSLMEGLREFTERYPAYKDRAMWHMLENRKIFRGMITTTADGWHVSPAQMIDYEMADNLLGQLIALHLSSHDELMSLITSFPLHADKIIRNLLNKRLTFVHLIGNLLQLQQFIQMFPQHADEAIKLVFIKKMYFEDVIRDFKGVQQFIKDNPAYKDQAMQYMLENPGVFREMATLASHADIISLIIAFPLHADKIIQNILQYDWHELLYMPFIHRFIQDFPDSEYTAQVIEKFLQNSHKSLPALVERFPGSRLTRMVMQRVLTDQQRFDKTFPTSRDLIKFAKRNPHSDYTDQVIQRVLKDPVMAAFLYIRKTNPLVWFFHALAFADTELHTVSKCYRERYQAAENLSINRAAARAKSEGLLRSFDKGLKSLVRGESAPESSPLPAVIIDGEAEEKKTALLLVRITFTKEQLAALLKHMEKPDEKKKWNRNDKANNEEGLLSPESARSLQKLRRKLKELNSEYHRIATDIDLRLQREEEKNTGEIFAAPYDGLIEEQKNSGEMTITSLQKKLANLEQEIAKLKNVIAPLNQTISDRRKFKIGVSAVAGDSLKVAFKAEGEPLKGAGDCCVVQGGDFQMVCDSDLAEVMNWWFSTEVCGDAEPVARLSTVAIPSLEPSLLPAISGEREEKKTVSFSSSAEEKSASEIKAERPPELTGTLTAAEAKQIAQEPLPPFSESLATTTTTSVAEAQVISIHLPESTGPSTTPTSITNVSSSFFTTVSTTAGVTSHSLATQAITPIATSPQTTSSTTIASDTTAAGAPLAALFS